MSQLMQARGLAVDDAPMTLRYVREALTKAGFIPLVTTDPDEAQAACQRPQAPAAAQGCRRTEP